MPNPALKTTLSEIDAVLKKHDLAGFVLVADRKDSDYLYVFGPSWSCARLEGRQLKIRADRRDYLTDDDFMETMANTVSMFIRFGNASVQAIGDFEKIAQAIGQQADITQVTHSEPPESGEPKP